uniref:Uncharacterized protein n=1 Tax=Arundo donax TaxID=35708 RepID=A0A0A9C214_ARUDO
MSVGPCVHMLSRFAYHRSLRSFSRA